MSANAFQYRNVDLVEYVGEADPFVPKGHMGTVVEVAGAFGPNAGRLQVSWHNDTESLVKPEQIRLVCRPSAKNLLPAPRKGTYGVDPNAKTITGVTK